MTKEDRYLSALIIVVVGFIALGLVGGLIYAVITQPIQVLEFVGGMLVFAGLVHWVAEILRKNI